MERHFKSLDSFLKSATARLGKGPVAMILVEDAAEVDTTIRHHQHLGFGAVIALMPSALSLPKDLQQTAWRVDYDPYAEDALERAVNAINDALPDRWLYYCYNAEFLFFPFCETRSVQEMLTFHEEERRDAMLTYVVDLYADDLHTYRDAVSLDHAHLDKSGYFALARAGDLERQLDFFGGLRWRFEEHIPKTRRKIDRIALFRSKRGLKLRPNHTFSVEEYNTYACPWHNNLTAAICSFRTAKALKTNPGSTFDIETFTWYNSAPFEWHSRQLLDLGLMEPGQWF